MSRLWSSGLSPSREPAGACGARAVVNCRSPELSTVRVSLQLVAERAGDGGDSDRLFAMPGGAEAHRYFAAFVAGGEDDRHRPLHQLVRYVENEGTFNLDVEQSNVDLRLPIQQLEGIRDRAGRPDDFGARGRQGFSQVHRSDAVVLDDEDASAL